MFRSLSPILRFTRPASLAPRLTSPAIIPAIAPDNKIRRLTNTSFRVRKEDKSSLPNSTIDFEAERRSQTQKLESNPEEVSVDSTTRKKWDEIPPLGAKVQGNEPSIQQGLKHDINTIRDTFSLSNIPRESHILGLSGTIPYFVTSLSTLYLTWDLQQQFPTSSTMYNTILIDHETARYLLSIIEPVQLGYGAIIISFLGAIHWGLEYAEKWPSTDTKRTRFRYGMGVAASIAAWPTILLSIEYGLIAQFMAFTALYFADSTATTKGWAPHWYGQYRFMLTAMVGLAIVMSLIGRSQLETWDKLSESSLVRQSRRSGIADTKTDWVKLEAEEKKKLKKERDAADRKAKREEQKKKQEKLEQAAGGGRNGVDTSKGGEEENDSDQDSSRGKGSSHDEKDEKKKSVDDQKDNARDSSESNANKASSDDDDKSKAEKEGK